MSDSTSDFIPTAMSTSALESKLKELKGKSNKHSQILTAKLASSQSGQNLLHIGTSLQTLPPDLHTLLTQLHPVLSCAEGVEKEYLQRLQKLVQCGNNIRVEKRRVGNAIDCAGMYEDLLSAEKTLRKDPSQRQEKADLWSDKESSSSGMHIITVSVDFFIIMTRADYVQFCVFSQPLYEWHYADILDQISLLERCAQTALFLVKDLQASNDIVAALTTSNVIMDSESSSNSLPSMRTSLGEDSERAQFLMKLAPRIRRLETDTIRSLSFWTEEILKKMQKQKERDYQNEGKIDEGSDTPSENELQLMIGYCMRGLSILGRGKEVQNIFARVAIM